MVRSQKIKKVIWLLCLLAGTHGACTSVEQAQNPSLREVPSDATLALLKAAHPQFARCYELAQDPRIGIVKLNFKITADGDVSESGLSYSTLKNADVESCCAQVVRKIRFEKSDFETREYDYPLEFGNF